jgi:hypothetical protein
MSHLPFQSEYCPDARNESSGQPKTFFTTDEEKPVRTTIGRPAQLAESRSVSFAVVNRSSVCATRRLLVSGFFASMIQLTYSSLCNGGKAKDLETAVSTIVVATRIAWLN